MHQLFEQSTRLQTAIDLAGKRRARIDPQPFKTAAAASGLNYGYRRHHLRYLVPIHGSIKGTDWFPIQKSPFSASSRISRNCAEACSCAPHKRFRTCHGNGVIDAEIAEKGHLCMETNSQRVLSVTATRFSISCISVVTAHLSQSHKPPIHPLSSKSFSRYELDSRIGETIVLEVF